MNIDVAKQLKSLSSNRIENVYRLFELIILQKLQQLSFVELNVSRKINIALQLNVVYVNKTTIKIVNRCSMMLSFVTIKRFE